MSGVDAVAPNLLVIAGLDPSGGAGLIADVRVAEQHGARAIGVATALTVQNSQRVSAANPVDPEIVHEQLAAVLSDVEIGAIKIGMLGAMAIAQVVSDALDQTGAPLVWDPVLASTIGEVALIDGDPRAALQRLSRHVTLITPNAIEARALTAITVVDEASAIAAGRALLALGVPAALIKGGHLDGAEAIDWLVTAAGVETLRGPRLPGSVHGTGCALSTAIAAHLAHGVPLGEACVRARAWLEARLHHPVAAGRGRPSVV